MRRRSFLAAGLIVLTRARTCRGEGEPAGISRVVLAHDQAFARVGAAPDERVAGELVEAALRALTGEPGLRESWRKLLGEARVVGLKPNCLARSGVASSPAFVGAVCRQIIDCCPAVERVIVWERSDRDLRQAGFEPGISGRVQCLGNDRGGYHPELMIEGAIGSLVSRTVVERCDRLINLPVLKDHGIVGVSACLKNHYGAVHNPNKYHLAAGDPYVADLNRLPAIRAKNALNLCEAFTAQYEGGPPYQPQWCWPAGLVLAATDPVALDRVAWRLIEEQRAAHGLPTLEQAGRKPSYILTAADAAHRLGIADPERIRELRVG